MGSSEKLETDENWILTKKIEEKEIWRINNIKVTIVKIKMTEISVKLSKGEEVVKKY